MLTPAERQAIHDRHNAPIPYPQQGGRPQAGRLDAVVQWMQGASNDRSALLYDAQEHALANGGCVPKPAYDDLADEVQRLTHLLGSHADGHRCTCSITSPAVYPPHDNAHPAEWEQDPWCPTHPDVDYIKASLEGERRLHAHEVRVLQGKLDHLEDVLRTYPPGGQR